MRNMKKQCQLIILKLNLQEISVSIKYFFYFGSYFILQPFSFAIFIGGSVRITLNYKSCFQ